MYFSRKVPENLNNMRIDSILKELNFVDSRNKAAAIVMAGKVFVNDNKVVKPGKIIKSDTIIKIKRNEHAWVSRGGIKLNKALKVFDVNVSDKICLDVGCSTGGFTDVLLKYEARKVYAVDVGYGQFDWKLRNSEKVILLERTNARNLCKKIISESIDIVVCDVSFISIKKVLLPVKQLVNEKYEIISMIKPQFEASKELVGRGGIVKDEKVHNNICREIKLWLTKNFQYKIIKIIESPILGQKGNKEFLIYLRN